MTPIPHRFFQQPWPEGEYRMFQIGFVVDDLVDAATQWADVLGVGPFHVMPRREVPCTFHGDETTLDSQQAIAQAGPVQIELIKDFGDGPSIYRELADLGGSRFHQLCTITPRYDSTLAHYRQAGLEVANEITDRGLRIAHVDTRGAFGFFTEVLEESPELLADTAKIATTCAEWDGRDPVRVLTRAGYRLPGHED
jgi:hypothetical protein